MAETDVELRAIGVVTRELSRLDDDARRRVLAWVIDRFGGSEGSPRAPVVVPLVSVPSGEMLTTQEVADLYKIPVWTVRKWRANGTGPEGVRIGRHVRYRRSDVDAWFETRRAQ